MYVCMYLQLNVLQFCHQIHAKIRNFAVCPMNSHFQDGYFITIINYILEVIKLICKIHCCKNLFVKATIIYKFYITKPYQNLSFFFIKIYLAFASNFINQRNICEFVDPWQINVIIFLVSERNYISRQSYAFIFNIQNAQNLQKFDGKVQTPRGSFSPFVVDQFILRLIFDQFKQVVGFFFQFVMLITYFMTKSTFVCHRGRELLGAPYSWASRALDGRAHV
eukprot:TRINITY_DN6353_c0_g1_i3.p3 TRINITY_DN6353_c0_g1~~TRINITY_DN6353_c0_g1_i3.p3  ORF type:complete len:222 (-),score=-11.21 TRINITY_DN6353_c0_g1_i3:41-706(-)